MRYKTITSASNPVIKEALREKRHRQPSRFFIEGHRLVGMALTSDAKIIKAFFTEEYRTRHEDFLNSISKKNAELIETTEHILLKLADTETPQGIAAVVHYEPLQFDNLKLKQKPLLVVADGIQDPGNLGTIIRTADAIASDAVVILANTCDPFSPKAIRSTAGSVFNLPIVYADIEGFVSWLKRKRINLCIADANASKTVYETDLDMPLAMVFGNEAHGVNEKLKKAADALLKIPITGKVESLNVAISAAICLYEAFRQRTSLS